MKFVAEVVLAILSVALALALALTIGIVIFTSSAWGLQWVLRGASLVGVQISAGHINGSLFGPIVLTDVHCRIEDGTRFDADEVRLSWSPGALWIGDLEILDFAAKNFRLTPHGPSAPTLGPPVEAPLTLPFRLVVKHAQTERFRILAATGATDTEIDALQFAALWSGDDVRVLAARGDILDFGPLQVSGDAELFHHSLRSRGLTVVSAVSGTVSGTYQYGALPSDLRVHLTGLEGYLKDTPISAVTGELHVTGHVHAYSFETQLHGQLQKIGVTGSGQGKGSLQGLHFNALDLRGAPGAMAAQGDIGWHGGISATLRAQLKHLDLSLLSPELKSDLNGTLEASTGKATGLRQISFTGHLEHSLLHGYPLTLDTTGSYAAHVLQLASLQVNGAGRSRLTASGAVWPALNLQATLDSADLGALWSGVGGAGHLQANVSGHSDAWHVVSQGHLDGVHGLGYSAQHLSWNADIDWRQAWQLTAQADRLVAGTTFEHAELQLAGPLAHQSATLTVRGPHGEAHVALNGALDLKRQAWSGTLAELRLTPARFSAVSLAAPAPLQLSAQRVALGEACLAGNAGRLCAQASWQSGAVTAAWHIPGIALEALTPLLPRGWQLKGQLQGQGELAMSHQALERMQGTLDAEVSTLQVPGSPVLQGLSARLAVTPESGGLRAQVDLKVPQGSLHGDLHSAAAATLRGRPLSGTVNAQIADLAWVSLLNPEIRHVQGTLSADARLGGTIGAPTITGEAQLSRGQLTLNTPGVTLKDLQAKVTGDGSGVVQLKGSAHSDTGTLAVEGRIDVAATPLTLDLHVTGSEAQVLDRADAHVWVTPDLHLRRDRDGLRLTGKLDIPQAEINPKRGLSNGAQPVSQDQILLGRGAPPPGTGLPVRAQVTISLGSKVRFRGYGLTSRLEGEVTVIDNPGYETRGTGELRLEDGHYRAYGQDLRIDSGRLIFTGGVITSPAIDIRASRRPTPQVTVGVHVRGTLAAPEFALESEPVMSREDQLGWLLLGQPLSQTSNDQKAAIQGAALSVGVLGSSLLSGSLIQRLGVNLSVSSEDTAAVQEYQAAGSAYGAPQPTLANGQALPQAAAQSPQLTLGKYLSPRLFISYGVSVFQPGQSVNLQYDIGHGFKVQTQTGTESGGDLLYTVEKGKLEKDKKVDAVPASSSALASPAPASSAAAPPAPGSSPAPATSR